MIKIYDDSKTFIVNKEIETVVAEIKGIMKRSSPYSEIRKIPELLERYTDLYNAMLDKMEQPVLAAIEAAHSRVVKELEGKEYKDVFSEKVYERFKEIKDKAKSCNNVATLQNIKIEADALKVRLLNEISAEEARIIAAKPPTTPPEPGKVAEPNPILKVQKTISIKSINSEATWRIETEADVDRYVEVLKAKLKQNIKEDTILNIEF